MGPKKSARASPKVVSKAKAETKPATPAKSEAEPARKSTSKNDGVSVHIEFCKQW